MILMPVPCLIQRAWPLAFLLLCGLLAPLAAHAADTPPNVILIITDDQGYGDLGIHGNRMIQTPHLDALARQSVRLTNFHSDPTCAETRSALMTGRYSCRVGVWHTIAGRSLLRLNETTMADVFRHSGYATGMFGKWHLGDNHPFYPYERGFDEALHHGGGGIIQTPDHWGNDYFDDTYLRNGTPEAQEGYCTDVWFREATKFIAERRDRPFFCYIATNAPHDPYNVDPKYARPYREKGVAPSMARFYGMITNIDENVGRLLRQLDEWKLSDNTIVIFMTDNGSSGGTAVRQQERGPDVTWPGFDAGLRGQKQTQYEGGHRVPCFIRWPGGKLAHGEQIGTLAAHFDLLPTLVDLCGLKLPRSIDFDGRSLKPLLRDPKADWEPRTLVVHSQRVAYPEKWRKTAVMTDRWRLVDGKELYDITTDLRQQTNIAEQHPDVVESLTRFYDAWWEDVSRTFDDTVRIPLGLRDVPPQVLTAHDWHGGQAIAFHPAIARDPAANGWWEVDVAQQGKYRFTLRARPAGVAHPLKGSEATVTVGEKSASAKIPSGADEVVVELDLPAGPAKLQTFLKGAGEERGAYYVTAELVSGE